MIDIIQEQINSIQSSDRENLSDGYHTFKELYEFRLLYQAILINEWHSQGIYNTHKSKRHSDEQECFGGGYFIVMADLPTGQISNHYPLKDWGLFQCVEKEQADPWDGHTAEDVAKRLRTYLETYCPEPSNLVNWQ